MGTLNEMVYTAAYKYSSKVAVTFESDNGQGCFGLTYSELVSRANELTDLLNMHVVLKEQIVGLYCQPNINVPHWILGILQIPAAYMPIDPDAPARQCVRVMAQSGLRYCVIQTDLMQRFQDAFSGHVAVDVCAVFQPQSLTLVRIQSTREQQAHREGQTEAWMQSLGAEGLAYVLHTSGTTGTPKVVRVPHKCIVPNIKHLRSLFQITANDVIFMASPLTFDPSVVDMFLSLSSGACLLIVPTVMKRIPNRLAKVLFRNHKTTVLQATPTLLGRFGRHVLQEVVLSKATSLRVLALGGEACPSLRVLQTWRQQGNTTQIFNLYGITEVSCWACCYKIPDTNQILGDDLSVPLGTPLIGTSMEVRDENGSVVTEGDGQVYIGGEHRVCFLGNETVVAPGTMRSTGDWVQVRNSHLYYLGRKDRLVKRNGKQLHLDAVQQVLEQLTEVEACAVMLCEGRLVAFVVPSLSSRDSAADHRDATSSSVDQAQLQRVGGLLNEDCIIFAEDTTPSLGSQFSGEVSSSVFSKLRQEILSKSSELLPSHAVPETLLLLHELPPSPHGKVSMDVLQNIFTRLRSASFTAIADRDAVTAALQCLWKEALGLSEDTVLSADANFVLSGGDSLRCLCLCDDIALSMGVEKPALLELLLNESFSDLVSYVANTLFPSENSQPMNPTAKELSPQTASPNLANIYTTQSSSKKLSTQTISFCPRKRPSAQCVSPEPHKRPSAQMASSELLAQKMLPSLLTPKKSASHSVSVGPAHGSPFITSSSGFVSLRRAGDIMQMGLSVLSLTCKGELQNHHWDCCSQTESENMNVHPGRSHLSLLDLCVRWTSDTGRCVDASPLLLVKVAIQSTCGTESGAEQTLNCTETTVYIGSHSHRLQAIDLCTGSVKWERVLGGRIESSAAVSACGGFIVVGCYDGNVYFFCADTGETYWVFGTKDAVKSCPATDPVTGLVLVGSHDGHVYALNLQMQCCVWKHLCGGGAVFSSPSFHPSLRQLYVATLAGSLLCLNTDTGDPLWTHTSDSSFFSSPNSSFSCVCIGSVDGNLYGFSHTGEKIWQFPSNGPIFSSPCVIPATQLKAANQRVVCGSHDGCVYCVTCSEGTLVWKFQTGGRVFSCPFAFDGSSWGYVTLVAISSTDGTLWILNGEDGFPLGSLCLPAELFSSPVLWQNSLVLGCRNDLVYCIDIKQKNADPS